MTCIVGLSTGEDTLVGADSAGATMSFIETRKDTKVFIKPDGWVIGFTDSFRMGQLLRYNVDFPEMTKGDKKDVYGFVVQKIIPAIRLSLMKNGWLLKENGREEGGSFVVGRNGELFSVEADFQVVQSSLLYTSVGAGEEYARGSLFSTGNTKMRDDPVRRVLEALKASAAFSPSVRGPFYIYSSRDGLIYPFRSRRGE